LSQITPAGHKIFAWPFGSFLALFQARFGPLQKLDLVTLSPVRETAFFHFFVELIAHIDKIPKC